MQESNDGLVVDGVLRVHLRSFKQLFEFSQFFHDSAGGYYFRGQADGNWKLTTTLERFESELSNYVGGARETLLKDFKRLIRGKGLLSGINPSSDEDFFSLGQHYGLPTPLLDWTEAFYIALFFAFADEVPKDAENVAVWVIHRSAAEAMEHHNSVAQELAAAISATPPLEMKFVDPYTDVNSRLISQSGILLQKPSGVCIETVISNYCRGNSSSPVLMKLTMPVSERASVINNLFAMNINWSTIYPGVEGAAKHATMKLQMLDLYVRRIGQAGVVQHSSKSIAGRVE